MRKADDVQIYVCVPRSFRERIEKHRKRNMRTMNSEIVYLLTRALEIEEAQEETRKETVVL